MTILDRLLAEIHRSRGPMRSVDLADRLGVAPSALDGMLAVLVANGTLVTGSAASSDAIACSGSACGATCVGVDECAFVASVPRTHHLVIESVR